MFFLLRELQNSIRAQIRARCADLVFCKSTKAQNVMSICKKPNRLCDHRICTSKRVLQFPLLLIILLIGFSQTGWSLYKKPWLGNPYEFEWQSAFTYSRYSKVQDAVSALSSPSNDTLFTFDLNFTASSFDLQAELELAQTPRQNFNWRSLAVQGRYLWLNDISGDTCSVLSGVTIRGVPHHSLRDISCPYASYFNAELTTAVGKEWSQEGFWTSRVYGYGALGMANRGAPWLTALGAWQINWSDAHRLLLALEGYFGFGGKKRVDIEHFNGWAHFDHQSLDVSIGYAYHMHIWGTLGINYAYRLFAKSFPQQVNFITIFYRLPFSFF